MKKTIIALLLLFVCFSAFADQNTKWGYNSESDCVYHFTEDFIVIQGNEVKYSATNAEVGDFEEGTFVQAIFYARDTFAIIYAGIVDEDMEIEKVIFADSFEDFSNKVCSYFEPLFCNGKCCFLDVKASEYIFNQLAYYNDNGQACLSILFKNGDGLIFNVNCAKLYQYTSLIKTSFYN